MISPAGMTWYMVWPGELWHGILYGLAGMAWRVMAWYIVWPGRHGMVYDKAWRGMAWYVQMLM